MEKAKQQLLIHILACCCFAESPGVTDEESVYKKRPSAE